MTSVCSNFLCGRSHGADPSLHVSTRAGPPPCGRHK